MSIEWICAVWKDTRIQNQGELLVALAIADFCNEKGFAWPSINSIAIKSRYSERGAQRVIRTLETKGVLKVHPQQSVRETNTYQLFKADNVPNCDKSDVSGVSYCHPRGDSEVSQLSPYPSVPVIGREVQGTVPLLEEGTGRDLLTPQAESTDCHPTPFERFWAAYPRKVGKDEARKVFERKKCSRIIEQIVSAVEAQKKGVQWCKDDGRFIPYPATWLNRGSWEDDVVLAMPRGSQPPQNLDAKRIALENERKRVQGDYDALNPQYDWDRTAEWSAKRKALKSRLMQIDGQLGALSAAA